MTRQFHPPPKMPRSTLDGADCHRVLVEWNQTARAYPRDQCIHQLFEQQVDRTPGAVALVCRDQSLTYRELNQRANRLARRLRAGGVGAESTVGVCLDRSGDLVMAMLAVLKAGGAYVPLDPAYPRDRLALMLADSRASYVITRNPLDRRLASLESHCGPAGAGRGGGVLPRLVLLDTRSNQGDSTNLHGDGDPRDLAYVIYTSGSTGTPKGVAIEHRNTVAFLHWVREAFTDDELAGVLAATSVCFDLSVFEIFGPLSWGGRVILASDILGAEVDEHWGNVTLINTVPSVMQALLNNRTPPPSLVTVNLAGEPLKPGLVDAIYDHWRPARVNDLYGPSETTTYSTWTLRRRGGPATVGRPIANTQVHILDGDLCPVAPGDVGELCIGGAGVARGYLHRPDLTAEKFVPNPFQPGGQDRIYRTGDLGRWRDDGTIELLGRRDQQVKVRGFRIELGEIERLLETHPDVLSCAVVAQSDELGGQCITAFVVPRDDRAISVHTLRAWLGQTLPEYMLPSKIAQLAQLPLTANGKIDRKRLEHVEVRVQAAGTEFAMPRTDLEKQLTEVWQEAFCRPHVGIHDNFFELGGHSLVAFAIASSMQSRLLRAVSPRWVFDHPTIAALARQLELTRAGAEALESIRPVDRLRPQPMSFGQQRMWLLQETLPERATYNVPAVYHFDGAVDEQRLRAALRAIMARHDILRTELIRDGEELVQRVLPALDVTVPLRIADWRQVPLAHQEQRMGQEVSKPFDLARAPLWRGLLATVGRDERVLALTFHHSVVDEWSLRLFFRELEHFFARRSDTPTLDLPALPLQHADCAGWQRQRLEGELGDRQRAYWSRQFREMPPTLELPTERPRPLRRSGKGCAFRFQLPDDVVAGLRELARQEATSLFNVALTTFQAWLYRVTGQEDLIVGTPVANRPRAEMHGLIGFFLNTLPVRATLNAKQPFRDLVRQVRQTMLSAMEHADLPYDAIEELAVAAGTDRRAPLYQVMFVLVEEAVAALRLGEARGREMKVHTGTAKNDLILTVAPDGQQWACELEYASDLFSAETAERMASHWVELVRAVLADPDQPIGRLNLLPATDRHRALVEWNKTARAYPRDRCIHQLFEQQVDRNPVAVALVADHEQLTYDALNRRANQLAYRLRQLGVKDGVSVAVLLDRSPGFVIGVLAILKAGGAYVPLNSESPADRLHFMLEDSGAAVVLSDGPLPEGVRTPGLAHLDFDRDAASINACPRDNPESLGTPESLAYIMYTSGSTGRPKGVAILHRGVVRLVRGQDYVEFDAGQRFMLLASTSFDASTFELWGPLLNGAGCVISPPGLPDYEALERRIRRQGVTCLWLTAGLFHHIIDQRPSVLATVRHVIAGGDTLSPAHVRRALDVLPNTRVTNGYGPTEGTTFTCTHSIAPGEDFAAGSVPIGRPIANTRCYILDEYQNPTPIGVPGELHIAGDGLARGYLNLPELTAERFVPDPFAEDPDARMYMTGDVARYLADGNIQFLGRRDRQIKIRGFRVEPGEIESALETHPDLIASAVVAQSVEEGDRRLTAFVVPRDGGGMAVGQLRAWLAETLPDYLLPSSVVVLERLPLTPNGKVDRLTLETWKVGEVTVAAQYAAPQSDVECQLAAIWQEEFRRGKIGIHDNFFDLGGDSMRAVQIVTRIHRAIGVALPVSLFLSNPTIQRLARLVQKESRAARTGGQQDTTASSSAATPLFLVGWYLDLESLDLEQRRSYVIPFPDFEVSRQQCRVELLAEACLRTLRTIRPHGPYMLAGYSLAGLVAFEMACRLKSDGEEVQLVAIVDTAPSTWIRRVVPRVIGWLGRWCRISFQTQLTLARSWFYVLEFVQKCRRRTLRQTWRALLTDVAYVRKGWRARRHRTNPTTMRGSGAPRTGPAPPDRSAAALGKFWAHRWAYSVFVPKPYTGFVALFTSEQLASERPAPGRGWRRWAKSLHEYTLPGTHGSCIRGEKGALVEKFHECLKAANGQEPS